RAAVATAAAVEGPDHPHPLSATVHYVSAAAGGPAEVHAEVLRRGREVNPGRARPGAGGGPPGRAPATPRPAPPAAAAWGARPAPAAFEECTRTPVEGGLNGFVRLPLMAYLDQRLDPAVVGTPRGAVTGRAEVLAWSSLADGRAPDPLSLLLAIDAVPP